MTKTYSAKSRMTKTANASSARNAARNVLRARKTSLPNDPTTYHIDAAPGSWRLTLNGTITVEASGVRRGRGDDFRGALSVRRDDVTLYRDTVTLTNGKSRHAFVKAAGLHGAVVPDRALLAIEEAIRQDPVSISRPASAIPIEDARLPDGVDVSTPLYAATSAGGLIWYKPTRDNVVPTPLTNFTAKIVEDRTEDDGVEMRRTFAIEGALGTRTWHFVIPAAAFGSMLWPVEHLGGEAIVFAGLGLRDHARTAIQALSGRIPQRRLYTHLGWRLMGKEWVYLHAGGAIGPEGPLASIDVAPPAACTRYMLPQPAQGEALSLAVKATLQLLDLGPGRVMAPLLAAVPRAVLGDTDFSIHIAGPTGAFKTEVAALIQQHFGSGMDARHLPGSWSSTPNSLEGLGFHAKDAILVVDDFAPTGNHYDIQRLHRDADRFLRAQGNTAGRGRMRPDGTLRDPKPPRCLTLSTGEDVPRGQSLRARVLVLEVSPGDIHVARLTQAQGDGAAGLYASCLAAFVHWLASQYEEVRASFQTDIETLRARVLEVPSHPRTPNILASLGVALRLWLRFAAEVGALTPEEQQALWERCWQALLVAGEAQAEHQRANEPTARFLELLNAAIASGRAHLASLGGAVPSRGSLGTECSAAWGWRRGGGDLDLKPQGDRIGWLDGDDLFIEPDAALGVAQDMARRQGDSFPLTGTTLHRRLHERKLLVAIDEPRKRLVVRHQIEGRRRSVLHLHVDSLMPQEPAQPAQTTQPPREGGDRQVP